jgi:hypothetical protein
MRPAFNDLTLENKLLLIEDLGTELLSIEYYDHRIHLYEFNNHLIESYINLETKQIEKMTICEKGDLDKFLTRITLPLHKWNTSRSNYFSDSIN